MTLAGLPYRVRRHEHIPTDDELVLVVLHCIGYPTKGTHPDDWSFALKVPRADLEKWPLGQIVRLEVTR